MLNTVYILLDKNLTVVIFIVMFLSLYLILKRYTVFFVFIYTFLGTVLHELSHFTVGLMLLGKPSMFSLIPKKENEGYTLGSVSFSNIKFFNAIPISFSPLLLLVFSAYLFYISLAVDSMVTKIILSYIISTSIISSKPSSADISIATNYKLGILFYLAIMLYFIYKEVLNV